MEAGRGDGCWGGCITVYLCEWSWLPLVHYNRNYMVGSTQKTCPMSALGFLCSKDSRGEIWLFNRQNRAEAEFMNVQFRWEISLHNLESSQTWGFRIQCLQYITNQFRTTFSRGGGGDGVKSLSRGDGVTFVPMTSKNSASARGGRGGGVQTLGQEQKQTCFFLPYNVNIYPSQHWHTEYFHGAKSKVRYEEKNVLSVFCVHKEEVKGIFSKDGCVEGLRNLWHVLLYMTLHCFYFF